MNDTSWFSAKPPSRAGWQWWLMLILVGDFALAVRIYYVMHAVVFQPADLPGARGDAVQYYDYARNLVQHGVFSLRPQTILSPIGDSFRDPGYPVFLAGWMEVFTQWDTWYAAVLFSQALLSALTVVLWLGVGRRWLSTSWLAVAGVIMAIWPHSVVMSSNLLSETLYGFLVALALFVFSLAIRRNSLCWSVASGICFALAALTNAVLLPFAALLALYLLWRRQITARTAFALIVTVLGLTTPWSIRNAMQTGLPSSSHRATMNFVQGSWPIYHSATKASLILNDPQATLALNQINVEIYTLEANHRAGLSMMLKRMARAPLSYVLWYLQKPALLWDWSLRIGAGDIYFGATNNSPYGVSPIWRGVAALCQACNRPLMLLALAGCLLALLQVGPAPEMTGLALLLLFVTAVHSVLQAEPRYSIPYRGAEIMLGVLAISWATARLSRWRNRAT